MVPPLTVTVATFFPNKDAEPNQFIYLSIYLKKNLFYGKGEW